MKINFARAVAAGMVATLVMTAVGLWIAPLMGMPLFSGSAMLALGSLVGHSVYGAVLGQVYGPVPARERAVPRPKVRSHA